MNTKDRQSGAGFFRGAGKGLPAAAAVLFVLALPACSLEKLRALTAPRPPVPAVVQPAPVALPTPMDTFRQLSPPEGLKFTPLFSDFLGTEGRLKRLEDTVQKMHDDFDTVVPALVRLVAIEKEMKALIAERRTAVEAVPVMPPAPVAVPLTLPVNAQPLPLNAVASPQNPPDIDWVGTKGLPPAAPQALPPPTAPIQIAPAPLPPPVPAPIAVAEPFPTPAPAAATGDVKAVRISDYSDKTRIVLDMTANGAAAPRLDNNGRTLVIDLGSLTWTGPRSWDADSAELISGYHVEKNSLHVDLMYAARIVTQDVLAATPENANVRLMIDLFSPDVHQAPATQAVK